MSRPVATGVFIFASTAALGTTLFLALPGTSSEFAGGLLFVPILLILTFPLLRLAIRRESDPTLKRLLVLAFFAKLAATFIRYMVIFDVYERGDALAYHDDGARIAGYFRDLSLDSGLDSHTGTDFIRLLVGILYTITGPNIFIGFLLFSAIGFWGLFMWYRAFRIALPDGDVRFFAIAVFFLPSMIFWPSSIGKEAWMTLGIGTAALGVARVAVAASFGRGVALFILGSAMASVVRPHVGLMLIAPAAMVFLLTRGSKSVLAPVAKMVGVAALLILTLFVASGVESQFELEDLSAESVDAALDFTSERTTVGGSASVVGGNWLVRVPLSIVTVLFRPFITEAHNAQALIAAIETSLLLALVVLRFRHCIEALRAVRRNLFVAFCLMYTVVFSAAYSSIGNLGILARQRVQVLPAFFVLLAVPVVSRSRTGSTVSVPEPVRPGR